MPRDGEEIALDSRYLIELRRGADAVRHELVGTVTIGRAPDSSIVLRDPSASRHHAEVRVVSDRVVLRDTSKNGTQVNGRRIHGPITLVDGDEVKISGVRLRLTKGDETLTMTARADRRVRTLVVDHQARLVWHNGRSVQLAPKEWDVLSMLESRRGQVVAKGDLATLCWPEYDGGASDYNVEQTIRRVREKIESDADQPKFLVTVRGIGYKLT